MEVNYLERDLTVQSSQADPQGRLAIPALFDLFMDLASSHAEGLDVGFDAMHGRCAYWVAVRTRLRLPGQRPRLGDTITARTWPGAPKAVKCDRFYTVARDGVVLAEGRTEWVGQNIDTGRVMKVGDFGYPLWMEHRPERVCDEPFTRFREQPDPANLCQRYTVGSRDIDMGRHMNNVAYVRMLLGTFTVAELETMDIAEAEISYSMACREGEELSVYRRLGGEGWHFLVQKPDGATAVQMALRLRK